MVDADGQDGEWFVSKRFGYGATPVTWQGWLLVAVYVVLVSLTGLALLPRHETLCVTIVAILTLGLVVITAQHTRGGLRWRWGKRS